MTNPRYEPRFQMRDPDSFGRVQMGTFYALEDTPRTVAFARAAMFQHRWAYTTRQMLKAGRYKGLNQQALAERSGISYQRLSRLLNGSIVLRLEDIAACESVLGSGVYATVLASTLARTPEPGADQLSGSEPPVSSSEPGMLERGANRSE
ncbi:helix-turn-helix domain-containing protein [Leifsonia aquatica]|uniref:helix-turn-helix domain-containing protein n=1 Tax=Leifsonia aquatica TaxID=144185 RepID=UPI0038217039